MTLITCVGDNHALAFNHRMVSRDKKVTLLATKFAKEFNGILCFLDTNTYQSLLQPLLDEKVNIGDVRVYSKETLEESYRTNKELFLFAPSGAANKLQDVCDKLILFHWNRSYPFDVQFQQNPKYSLKRSVEFEGNSHENILLEVYTS